MSDSDFDDDIDKLLDEFDTNPKVKEETPTPSNTKYRSVRPSSFNTENESSTQRPTSPKKQVSLNPPSVQRPIGTGTKPGSFLGGLNRDREPEDDPHTKQNKADGDWLGLGPASEPSPFPTPVISRKLHEQRERTAKSEENFDEDSFLKKLSALKSKPEGPQPVSKLPEEISKQQRSIQIPVPNPKEHAPINRKPPSSLNTTSDIRIPERQTPVPSFMEKLNIAQVRSQSVEPESLEIGTSGAGDPGAGIGQAKKKVLIRKSTGQVIPTTNANSTHVMATGVRSYSTLQVPSHLIDEDELKLMSTSLKTLFGNQVDMIEKSYKEQMDCLTQSFGRKEEMLKEENRMMQKEYESRINKLKNDFMELESKSIQRIHQDSNNYSSIMEQLKLLSIQNEKLFSNPHETQTSLQPQAQLIAQEINTNINSRLLEFLEKLSNRIEGISSLNPSQDLILKNNVILEKLEKVSSILESTAKLQKPDSRRNGNKDTESRVESELSKILKEHKKLRSTLIKTTVSTMTQSLETNNQNQRKKDKISSTMKEFRKDFQRVMLEIDLKQDSVHKSQVLIESQLNSIFRNLNELSLSSGPMNQNQWAKTNPNLASQESIQNEIEIKLLRDERNTLSEKIATLNVEKRKLNDERVQLENDKREFERDKLRIHDLETMLKIKVSDAENMKKESEILRLENIKLNGQLSKKLNELDREYMQTRDFENNLQHQRQKHIIESAEIQRDKEMLEKLRQELLCPGCLKFIPPPRSHGDGIDEGMKIYYAPPTLPKFNLEDF